MEFISVISLVFTVITMCAVLVIYHERVVERVTLAREEQLYQLPTYTEPSGVEASDESIISDHVLEREREFDERIKRMKRWTEQPPHAYYSGPFDIPHDEVDSKPEHLPDVEVTK